MHHGFVHFMGVYISMLLLNLFPCFHFPVSHGLVRLVGGNSPNEGRVEVFHQGEWGTVCDDHWSDVDAGVVCRELGYARAINSPGFGTFGQGTGRVSEGLCYIHVCGTVLAISPCMSNPQIWLDDVECDGTESSIFQCSHSAWGQHDCVHSEDASAVCTGAVICLYILLYCL